MSKIWEDTAKELVKYEKIEAAERMLERGKLTKEEMEKGLLGEWEVFGIEGI